MQQQRRLPKLVSADSDGSEIEFRVTPHNSLSDLREDYMRCGAWIATLDNWLGELKSQATLERRKRPGSRTKSDLELEIEAKIERIEGMRSGIFEYRATLSRDFEFRKTEIYLDKSS